MPPRPSGPALTVLIAHRCAATRSWLRAALLQGPGIADEAGSAWEALEQLAERPYRLAVVDRYLPGMGGAQLLASCRAAGIETPMLLLAPVARDSLRALVRRAGKAAVVEESYNAHALRAWARALTLPRAAAARLGRRSPAADAIPILDACSVPEPT